jgi:hypothetical protein
MANTFLRKTSRDIGANLTVVGNYTVPANVGAVIVGLCLSNTTTSDIEANVAIDNGLSSYYIVNNAPITDGSSLVVAGRDQKIILQTGDSVKINSSAADSIDVVMSIMETDSVGISYEGANPTGTWLFANSVPFSGISGDVLTSTVYDGSKFVAVKGNPYGSFSNAIANSGAYSSDGIAWTEFELEDDGSPIFGMAAGGGRIVVPYYTRGNVAVSSNGGITWTKHANVIPDLGFNFGPTITSVAYGDGKFVAVEYMGPATYISTDGVTWTGNLRANLAPGSFNTGIRYGGGKFVVLHQSSSGNGTFNFYHSANGVDWSQSVQVPVLGSEWVYGYGGGAWVALPNTGLSNLATGMRSTDGGHTWSNIALPNAGQQFGSVVYDGQQFVGVSSYNPPGIDSEGFANSIVSSDGITWSNIAMPVGARIGGASINNTSAYGAGTIVVLSSVVEYSNVQVLHSTQQ